MPKQAAKSGGIRAPRVLLVEDDEILGETLARFMTERLGWKVELASGVKAGRSMIERARGYELVISDVLLRDGNGMDLIPRAQARGTKVIMMSGVLDREIEKDSALQKADGFLAKPFLLKDLHAKMVEVLGMKEEVPVARNSSVSSPLRLEEGRRLSFRGRILPVKLTPKETDIAHEFIRNFGSMVSRESLYRRVYAKGSDYGVRKLEVHLHNFRKKIEEACESEVQVRNIRSQGYVLELREANAKANLVPEKG